MKELLLFVMKLSSDILVSHENQGESAWHSQ